MNKCIYCGDNIASNLRTCLCCHTQFEPLFEFVIISAELLPVSYDPLERIERMGRICYQSESKGLPEKFFRMLVKRGHESVLEHAVFTFDCICDRGISHELVRHRIASYSQESTRYCDYSGKKVQFIRPSGLPVNDSTQHSFCAVLKDIIQLYKYMLANGCTPQQARAILPNCLKTEIGVTMNLREIRHFLRLRTSKAAHPEMQTLARCMRACLEKAWPIFFEDMPME